MTVPVLNLYYMYLYAWDRLEEAALVRTGVENAPTIRDLFARVLAGGVELALRRGLERVYQVREEEVFGVRGKILLGPSIVRATLSNASVVCETSDLSCDTPANRIIRETMRALLESALEKESRENLATAYRKLPKFSRIRLCGSAFAGIQLHSNNAFYGFLLDVCRFLYDSTAPTTGGGERTFYGPDPDGGIGLVFQRFIRNFFAREQNRYRTTAPWVKWHRLQASEDDLSLLPIMQTDIVLRSESHTVVLDTKYYANTVTEYRGRQRIHSDHLYQMFAYLANLRPTLAGDLSGIILYAQVERPLDAKFAANDVSIRVATIDLSQPWKRIHDDLLTLVGISPTRLAVS